MLIRRASTCGFLDAGWITSRRQFSNNSYWNPEHLRWECIRVINDDCQQPGNIVPRHRHAFFDILGYMIDGELEHWDNLGNLNRAVAGQVQHMWCGRGIEHTEASVGSIAARYLQIWIIAKKELRDIPPYYELVNRSPDYSQLPIDFKQDINVYGGNLHGSRTINTKKAYGYVVSGTIVGDGFILNEGDSIQLNSQLDANFDCHLVLLEPHN